MTALERRADAPTLTLNKRLAALDTALDHTDAALTEICQLATLAWTRAGDGCPLPFAYADLEAARAALRRIAGAVRSERLGGDE